MTQSYYSSTERQTVIDTPSLTVFSAFTQEYVIPVVTLRGKMIVAIYHKVNLRLTRGLRKINIPLSNKYEWLRQLLFILLMLGGCFLSVISMTLNIRWI